MTQSLTVEVRGHQDHAVVTISGELVEASVATMRRSVTAVCAMYSRVIVNVEAVTYVDDSGFGELMGIREQVSDRHGHVQLVGMRRAIRRRAVAAAEGGRQPLVAAVEPAGIPRQRHPPSETDELVAEIDRVLGERRATDEEGRALALVLKRLRNRFPAVPETTVAQAVAEACREFDGHPVRDFVPIFVEREAAETLRGLP